MNKPSGLGRGLGALIPKKSIEEMTREVGERVLEIPVGLIRPNPRQPRTDFGAGALDDLMQSIAEHGILQPLIVIKLGDGYELIAGERRLRASKLLGLKTVPAIVRSATDQQKLELSLIENVQREDLNPIEAAKAYKQLIDDFGLGHEEVAKKVGKSRPAVSNTIRLLDLPAEMQQALIDRKIGYGAARALLGVPSEAERLSLFRRLMQGEKIDTKEIEHKAAPQRRVEDPNLKAAETELREALGAKVTVSRRGNRGTIVIEFYSDEELRNVLNHLAS